MTSTAKRRASYETLATGQPRRNRSVTAPERLVLRDRRGKVRFRLVGGRTSRQERRQVNRRCTVRHVLSEETTRCRTVAETTRVKAKSDEEAGTTRHRAEEWLPIQRKRQQPDVRTLPSNLREWGEEIPEAFDGPLTQALLIGKFLEPEAQVANPELWTGRRLHAEQDASTVRRTQVAAEGTLTLLLQLQLQR